VMRRHHHQLDASVGASGPHDFAVRKLRRSSARAAASIASRTNVRDDRETPLSWDGMAGDKPMIWVKSEAKIFLRESWTTRSPKDPTGKSMRTIIPGHGCGQIRLTRSMPPWQ
jgi:hypothetical protein